MSKRRKITFGVLAVILVFCLWYTRPRSFSELVGDSEIENFTIITTTPVFKNGRPDFEVWTLEVQENGQETASFREILQNSRYRASLINLIPSFLDNGTVFGKGDSIIHFGIVLENGEVPLAICRGSGITFKLDRNWKTRATDRNISEKIMALVQQYGAMEN